jgi:DNA-nicking Smr family endonuclease
MKKRLLTRGEWALWAHVAGQAKPLPGRKMPVIEAEPQTTSTSDNTPGPMPQPLPMANQTQLSKPALPKPLPLAAIERRMLQRVSRGQKPVDGVIDLHGMRQSEAHFALLNFIHRMHANGASLVLVITGKGAADPAPFVEHERGVLRRMVPHWLSDLALRRQIIGFEEAGRRHGGGGALYVRIRRAKGNERLFQPDY